MQLMNISGIYVSPGVMAFSYILEHLDGVVIPMLFRSSADV